MNSGNPNSELDMKMERSNTYAPVGYCAAFIMGLIVMFVSSEAVYGYLESFPEPNPPKIQFDEEIPEHPPTAFRGLIPTTEWAYHKTSDNAHPDANEQQMMWLMNRARTNPTNEGIWLAGADDPNIISALNFYNVDLGVLQNEFGGYDTKPPAAFDMRLYNAAKAHSEYLIGIDDQNHDNQFDRITDENFSYTEARGNVFSYSKSALYGHAAFNIDWGPGDGTGMQPGRGHRMAIMSVDGDYTNVGIAAVIESDTSTGVGPIVITGNFCKANTFAADHYNRFLVGTVWSDYNDNDFFDPGEGIGGVTVMPDLGTYYAVTSDSGGYALPLTESGDYEISFSGSAISGEEVKTVMVGADNVLLDLDTTFFTSDTGSVPPPIADSGGGGGPGGCFIAAATNVFNMTKELWLAITFLSLVLIGFIAFHRKKITYYP